MVAGCGHMPCNWSQNAFDSAQGFKVAVLGEPPWLPGSAAGGIQQAHAGTAWIASIAAASAFRKETERTAAFWSLHTAACIASCALLLESTAVSGHSATRSLWLRALRLAPAVGCPPQRLLRRDCRRIRRHRPAAFAAAEDEQLRGRAVAVRCGRHPRRRCRRRPR